MSLVNLANVCSHLQNASKARLGLTSIPVSKMHVNLMLGLQREGFLSSVTLGGTTPPKPYALQTAIDPDQHDKIAQKLVDEPWAAYPAPSASASASASPPSTSSSSSSSRPDTLLPPDTLLLHTASIPQNPARRRLWLGLKYWNNEPVLRHMKLVSKPTRRIWLTGEDLEKITRTRPSSYVKGLTHPGECMFLTTDRGILEARECVERRLGGMALCRIWG
jgi:ribosomal protein S8